MDARKRGGRLLLDCLRMHDSLDSRELFRLDTTNTSFPSSPHRRTSQFFPLAFTRGSSLLTPFFSQDDVPTLVMSSRLATAVPSPTGGVSRDRCWSFSTAG
jgi:hypothetical protein